MQVQKETEFVKIPLKFTNSKFMPRSRRGNSVAGLFLVIYFRIVLKPTCIPWTELGLDMFSV